jgi:hypothetical protein
MTLLAWAFIIAAAALISIIGGEVADAIQAWREARKGERYE